MGLYVHNEKPNGFVRVMRKLYNDVLQFKKGYNFVLWFIFAGALVGFVLARLQYLDINGIYKNNAAPGEWYYIQRPYYKAGMLLHLSAVLPAGLLVPWQFIPAIRYKALLFHRLNGYLLLLLLVLGNIGALMIVRYTFGGTLATQSFAGALAIATLTSAALAFYNIKRLQIDQHRAWMIRTWVYMGVIITIRIIMVLSALIISNLPGYFFAIPCRQLASMGADPTIYPACAADMAAHAAVRADFASPDGVENVAASMFMSFGTAGWLGLVLHVLGAEIYLRLTPAEDERLRRVSHARQLERGFAHPGSAGLTADRLGDAYPWSPPSADELAAEEEKEEEKKTLGSEPRRSESDSGASAPDPGVRKPDAAAALGWK